MRITLLNQKGGVGKTTLALLLASVLDRAGYDVAIDDRDPQGSASFFARSFGLPLFDPKKPASYILTDTPGHLRMEGQHEREMASLIGESDVLLLVTGKSPASIHGSAPMARLIKKHKARGSKAYVLFNQVRARTAVGQQDSAAIAADLGLPVLSNELPLAAAYENAYADGLAAVTGKHRTELLNLALEVMK